ncbi:MAG: ABC transporter ATP-binding protein [Lachnospiraceae bacterium]|nr:ABC transporter ATP-binding protein [Lachnospiraceae bacterium]
MEEISYICEARELKQYFPIRSDYTVKAVDGVSFGIMPGEVFGLVGETGCGKSTIAKDLCGIYNPTSGEVLYKGRVVSGKAADKEYVERRKKETQIVFQDSAAALNPRMKVEDIVLEPLLIQQGIPDKKAAIEKCVKMLEDVGLGAEHLGKLPGELSGGQRQRVSIARSLMVDPQLIIADEPIASLDISIQAQIINLFKEIQEQRKFAMLFVAHDLSVVRFISDRVGVMYMGKLVETGTTEEVFNAPQHEYTKKLLSSITIPDPRRERARRVV